MEFLGPLGMEAPLGEIGFGACVAPIAWAWHPGSHALDVEIGESMILHRGAWAKMEISSESLSWRREGFGLSCNS